MPIGEKKTCTTHTKEKERLGICCQEDQEKAEQQTYEHTIRTPQTGVCNCMNCEHEECEVCQ